MPNKPGHTFQFDYKESISCNRTAKLDDTNFSLGPEEIEMLPSSAVFILSAKQGENPTLKTDKNLVFLGTDNRSWQLKVDLLGWGFMDRTICVFEEFTCLDKTQLDDENMDVNGKFHIYDWDGSKWEVEIDRLSVPADNSLIPIGFTLTPID